MRGGWKRGSIEGCFGKNEASQFLYFIYKNTICSIEYEKRQSYNIEEPSSAISS